MSKDHAVKVDSSTLSPSPRLHLRGLIGNTPMIRIYYLYNGHVHSIFAKLESFNMTGSIKDRMAVHIIERSYQDGSLKKGDWIVEATSGNTGISLSAIGRALGHPVKIFMPDWMSRERVNLIRQFGAEIQLVSKEDGGFLGSIAMARDFANQHGNVFLPSQFDNPYNCQAHYETTGPEIWNQLARQGLRPHAFVAGVGTGGTVMGVGRYLKEQDPQIRVHPLEPSNSPTLSTGYKTGHHRIQGISDEFIPSILKLDELDAIVEVDDGDTIIMAQQLACKLGLGLGISSGANFLGAIKIREQLPDDAVVCTVFSDSNKKYLSTDLLKDEPRKGNCETCLVDLLHFEVCP